MPSFKMKFSGVTILQGVEFLIFPIDFEWALQQCSATALPVIITTTITAVKLTKTLDISSNKCYILEVNLIDLTYLCQITWMT